ncbi:MAG TPA: SWIM zinc finger family protein [Streptomyces sp.]|nr:SWIM zinc finger family protein [Streptomyces sp.]
MLSGAFRLPPETNTPAREPQAADPASHEGTTADPADPTQRASAAGNEPGADGPVSRDGTTADLARPTWASSAPGRGREADGRAAHDGTADPARPVRASSAAGYEPGADGPVSRDGTAADLARATWASSAPGHERDADGLADHDGTADAGRPVRASSGAGNKPGADGPVSRDGTAADLSNPSTPAPALPPPAPSPAPAPAALPPAHRSMSAPARDGELRRTFPAFPARPAGEAAFAGTWWGNAWVAALEEGALDGARLARGRTYAAQGHVDAITVTPGLALAYVQGSRPRPYRVQVRLRTLGDADWERFLEAAAERPGHIAALLDKELPQSLADCGVPLLPGPGDLTPRCSCPDSGHPCKHAAALCYQTARLLDADPFVLLLLRGRGERGLLESLSRLSAARAARAAQERAPADRPAVRAAEVLARGGPPAPPPPLPAPPHPEQPPVYPAAPGGPDPLALDQLATDAAARAHALLTTGRDPVEGLTPWQDAVRLAAARPGSGLTASTRALYSSLATATGRTPAGLARAVAAWRQGGLAGLSALEEPWDPPAGRFDRARPLLLAADLPAFRPRHNTLTHPAGHLQLRLGRDALWYAYESEPGRDDWWPRGTPDPDPVGALTGLGAPHAGNGTDP